MKYLYLDESGVPKDLQDRPSLYRRVFESVVESVIDRESFKDDDALIIITDTLPVQKRKSQLRAELKRFLKGKTRGKGIAYMLYHHESASDVNLQVADYCCWAINRELTTGDCPYYYQIKNGIVYKRVF